MRHFTDITDLRRTELSEMLRQAIRLKAQRIKGERNTPLAGRVVGLAFEKPSLRTRVSFESAVAQLGGVSLFLPAGEVGLGWRETIADFARTMSRYVDAMVLRVFKHETVVDMSRFATCPVINGLSDTRHPCQALADLMTVVELFGDVQGKTITFVGDGNNVARSLALGVGMLGGHFVLSAPAGFSFEPEFVSLFRKHAHKATIHQESDPAKAVKKADVIYTDVWTSMGQEAEREDRLKRFAGFQVNAALLAKAPAHCKVMHCLPAHRGEEITDDVMDGPQSVVFDQAENRLHAQKAILCSLLA
jgi:ornithine carbamoyltransferase